MKYFAMLQWTEDKYVEYEYTNSATNYSDSLSKINGSTKHHEHFDISMGKRKPLYAMQSKVNSLLYNHYIDDYPNFIVNMIAMTRQKDHHNINMVSTSNNLEIEQSIVHQTFDIFNRFEIL